MISIYINENNTRFEYLREDGAWRDYEVNSRVNKQR